MVGSGAGDRSKEAVGMMALHEALRSVCLNSDWTYSVFWTIRPRPRVRGGNGCKVGDDNGSLMLMWEDGFCRGRVADCLEEMDSEDPVRKAFSKMSIQLYNYGEGWVLGRLMGKVASDKCHKWVFKEPSECEPNISNYWQSSFDALPTEWTDQFESGIQIPEDLHFVLRMRHTFESLGYQSGFYLSQLFSSTRNASSSSSIPSKQPGPPLGPPPLFNWSPRALSSPSSMLAPPNFQRPLGFTPAKDEPHMFLMPHSAENRMDEMMGEHESDIKWPNGLSFFNALTGRADEAKLLFSPENLGHKPDPSPSSEGPNLNMQGSGGGNPNEFLSLDNHHQEQMRKNIENKFKRSFTLPARMTSSGSSTSLDHHSQHPQEYRNPEGGMYSDVMDSFMDQ
ncbi:Protein RICE SALT SENSITIVE 3 [Bienertia sinuspersici]